ncbi:FtsX-like permease family protein [compost metagenome]
MALGATPRSLVALVLRQALSVAALGAGVGLVAAFALAGTVSHLLYDVGPTDPSTFAVMTIIPLLVAILASALPARRASRVDPLVSLRHD